MLGTRKTLREIHGVMEEIRAMRRDHGEMRGEQRAAFDGLREEMRAARREHAEHIAQYQQLTEDNRQFTRECVTRMQQAAARQEKHLDGLLDESRAQRQALLRMIDRLGPAPGAAGA